MGYTNWDNHFAAVQGPPGVTSEHPVVTIAALIGLNHLAHRWWRNRNQAKQAQRTPPQQSNRQFPGWHLEGQRWVPDQ